MRKWEFDKQFLEENVNKGIILLNGNELNKTEKNYIKSDLQILRQYLTGDFECYGTSIKNYKSIEKLKKYVLKNAQYIYSVLGKELIDWIIELNKENLFNNIRTKKKTKLSIDVQAEFTIKNYEKNSKYLLKFAKEILSPKPTSQIQIIGHSETGSYCHYSDIAEIPLILIDPADSPTVLNHEIQHAIEFELSYNTPEFFDELGAIYFELLFLDMLYKNQGFLYNGDYGQRLNEVSYQIDSLAEYFKIIKIFAKNNFNIETNKFINLFIDHMCIDEDEITNFLNELITSGDIESDITYLLSSLKAIELRNENKSLNIDSINLLKQYIKYPKYNFNIPKDYLKLYELYINEMKQKTKKRQK